jgi:hypothetical protein
MKTKPKDHHKKHDDDDKRKDKDHQKSKGNNGATNTTDHVRQGRWRTVTTDKVPSADLTQPEDNSYVEHRPLGF